MKNLKNLLVPCVLLVALSCDSVPSEEAPEAANTAPGEEKRIVLVNVGEVDKALMKRVAAHVRKYLETTPAMAKPRDALGSTNLVKEAEALVDLIDENTHCVVGVINASEKAEGHLYADPAKHVGLVNATALRPAEMDEEKYARRVDKNVVCVIGLLSDFPECPIPNCALFRYRSEKELDQKGRSLCPPHYVRWLKLHEELDLEGDPYADYKPQAPAMAPEKE